VESNPDPKGKKKVTFSENLENVHILLEEERGGR
jgi:hypothetical protein